MRISKLVTSDGEENFSCSDDDDLRNLPEDVDLIRWDELPDLLVVVDSLLFIPIAVSGGVVSFVLQDMLVERPAINTNERSLKSQHVDTSLLMVLELIVSISYIDVCVVVGLVSDVFWHIVDIVQVPLSRLHSLEYVCSSAFT